MPVFHGSDTSNNQGSGVVAIGPEIQQLGGDGWWHKATQSSGFRDPYWTRCRQNRIDVGLRYGGPYHWLSPNTPVADQFRNFRDFVGGLTVGEGIQLDMEEGGLTDSMVIEAVELWEDEWPGRNFHYMGRFFVSDGRSYMVDRMVARFGSTWRWWLPWYTNTYPTVPYEPIVWQYAGGATGVVIPSLGRRVDSNQIIDVARLEQVSGYGGVKPPQPGGPMGMNGLIIDLVDSWVVLEAAWTQVNPDGSGGRVATPIRWIDGPTRADRLASGYDRIDRSWRDLKNLTYVGAVLPQGDGHPSGPGVNWDGSQFRDYVINQGLAIDVPGIINASVVEVIRRLSNG